MFIGVGIVLHYYRGLLSVTSAPCAVRVLYHWALDAEVTNALSNENAITLSCMLNHDHAWYNNVYIAYYIFYLFIFINLLLGFVSACKVSRQEFCCG